MLLIQYVTENIFQKGKLYVDQVVECTDPDRNTIVNGGVSIHVTVNLSRCRSVLYFTTCTAWPSMSSMAALSGGVTSFRLW